MKQAHFNNISFMDKFNASALMLVTPEYSTINKLRQAEGYASKQASEDKTHIMPLEHTVIDGIDIRFARSVSEYKPTVVLLSPLPQSILAYSLLWESFSQHFNLYALDMPGFGGSEGGKAFMNFKAQGEFLQKFLQHFNLTDTHIVGPDVGMPAALYHVGTHQHKVKSIIVGDGPAVAPSTFGSIIDKMGFSSFWQFIMGNAGAGALVEAGKRIGYVNYTPNEEELSDYKNSYDGRLDDVMEWFKGYPESLATVDPLLETIQVPSLIFWGENDEILQLDNGIAMQERMPNSELHVFEHCGHFAYQDKHQEFEQMVMNWVNKQTQSH